MKVPILLMSNQVSDARVAMAALIESRALPYVEGEPDYPEQLARLSWAIAIAMDAERERRARGSR